LPAANDVKVDITIDEVLCFPLQDRAIQRTYDSFDDLPEGPTVKVYAIEEIVIEKLLALSDRARNEPRDLYDLWYLFDAMEASDEACTVDVALWEKPYELPSRTIWSAKNSVILLFVGS
jgi:predicted nucleotidyltransferase component of viral defense system